MFLFKILLKVTLINLLLVNSVFSQTTAVNEFPSYKDGKLTIPRVDTDGQASNFQDAAFQFDSAAGAWKLLDFKETTITPGQGIVPDTVEVIVTSSTPIQVFLKVSGQFSSGCEQFGQINQRLKDNKFEITLHLASIPANTACATVLVPYEKIIPLQVYGLSAGTYEYSVNGEHTGTFTLTKENTL